MSWEERFRSKRLIPASDMEFPETEEPDLRALYRQSLNVREYREAITRFSGDPQLAAGYIPVARMLLGGLVHQLALGGINFGHRIVNLPDGTKIRVIHNSGINLIEITAQSGTTTAVFTGQARLFLESGFVRISDIYPLDAEEKPAGLLYYSQRILNEYEAFKTIGELVIPEDENELRVIQASFTREGFDVEKAPWLDWFTILKNAAGYVASVREYTPGMDSLAVKAVLAAPPEGYISGEKKRLQWLIKLALNGGAIVQTGKMKLFLQVQMGRFTDDGLKFFEFYADEPSVASTYGIYFSKKYGHYLLRVSTNNIQYTKLDLPVEAFLLTLREEAEKLGDKEDRKRITTAIDAYIFSTAVYSENEIVWENVKFGDSSDYPDNIQGTPFHYGWKSNWDGTEWSVVTQEAKLVLNVWIDYWIARKYVFTLSDIEKTDKDGELYFAGLQGAFDIESQETVNWTPRPENDYLWYPNVFFGVMMPFVFVTSAFIRYSRYLDADAPVYCFYNDDDQRVEIRHALARYSATPYPYRQSFYPWYIPPYAQDPIPYVPSTPVLDYDVSYHQGGLIGGFYCQVEEEIIERYSDGTVSGKGRTVAKTLWSASGTTEAEVFYTGSGGWTSGFFGVGSGPFTVTRYSMEADRIIYTYSNRRFANLVLLPYGDAEAIYLGGYLSENSNYVHRRQKGSVNGKAVSKDGVWEHFAYWMKEVIWGAGTSMSECFASGKKDTSECRFTLVTRANELTNIYSESAEGGSFKSISGANCGWPDGGKDYETEMPSVFSGTMGILFSPTLFGDGISTYNRVLVNESVLGDCYYMDDLGYLSETSTDKGHLPDSNFNGLFVGWN